ncbi:MAG TPA: hypothetical protein P5150_09090 [Candidatus Ratteibacteria bacterium]|nr:hypothetical protein [Candidatus Ratteibacteria bacterium]
MKKELIVFLGFLLVCSFAFGEWIKPTIFYGAKKGTEPDGFRGIKWETDISTLPDMKYFKTDPSFGGMKGYIRKGDKLQIGAAKLKRIEYDFWHGKFLGVLISTKGHTNWYSLKDAVFEKFGKVCQKSREVPNGKE